MKNYNFLQQAFVVNTYVNRGLTLVKGEGVYLYDENGNKYLDLMSNYGVNILGHSHSLITKHLSDQLGKLTVLHGSFASDTRAEAAFQLVKRCGGELLQVYFSNSGAEAVEAALKFAVLATGKKKFISASHGYHGKTLGALSATYGDKYKKMFSPLLWDFEFVEHGNTESLEKAVTPDVAAFIVEPIQGEGGIYTPPSDYLQKVREVCDKHNILLILDEIQTGCGRTGTFLASQKSKIRYDIVCMGKGLAGGLPIGATLVSKEIAVKIPKQIHTSTFGGNPLACAGIIATLELLSEEMMAHVQEMGTYFISQLKTITSPLVSDVRGQGLMIGLEMKDKRNEVLKALQIHTILAIPAGENVVRFLPPFIIQKKHIDEVITVLNTILKDL
ncbi:MAG: aspartate aminotransferase family protein [Candidatus Roizmanbacteria bacterium]|nr:aspartate aminotransferase family protein [Candidatus Roizmanbacteria bacterium]